MTSWGANAPGAFFCKRLGVGYKIGLLAAVTGIVVLASSAVLGGIVSAAFSGTLELLGGSSPSNPEGGSLFLLFLGSMVLGSGACITAVRLVMELLGLGSPGFTDRLSRRDKIGSGLAAAGLAAAVSSGIAAAYLELILLIDEVSILVTILRAGIFILLCGVATLLAGERRRRRLLGWTDRTGWGRARQGWINKLAIALVLSGIIFAPLLPMCAIAAMAGAAIIALGLFLHSR